MTNDRPDAEIRPFRVDIPQADLDDLRERLARPVGPARPRRRLGPRVPLDYLTELADHWRTSYTGANRGRAQRIPAVHHYHRRAERPLPTCALARAGRLPADPQPRVAWLGGRVSRRDRPSHGPSFARRRSGGRLSSGDPFATRLRVLRADPCGRLGRLPDRRGVRRTDGPAGIRALRGTGRRLRGVHLARYG